MDKEKIMEIVKELIKRNYPPRKVPDKDSSSMRVYKVETTLDKINNIKKAKNGWEVEFILIKSIIDDTLPSAAVRVIKEIKSKRKLTLDKKGKIVKENIR